VINNCITTKLTNIREKVHNCNTYNPNNPTVNMITGNTTKKLENPKHKIKKRRAKDNKKSNKIKKYTTHLNKEQKKEKKTEL